VLLTNCSEGFLMVSKRVALDRDRAEDAASILKRWAAGDGLPAHGELARHEGTAVGVAGHFHGLMVASAGTFETFSASIRAGLDVLHHAHVATVAELAGTDERAASAANSLLAEGATLAVTPGQNPAARPQTATNPAPAVGGSAGGGSAVGGAPQSPTAAGIG